MGLERTTPLFENTLRAIDRVVSMMVQSLVCICPLVNIFLVPACTRYTSQFSLGHSAHKTKFITI